MEIPSLSIIMGIYYQKDDLSALKKSIESILNQTYTSFELIICDDGSTDAVCQLLDFYMLRDKRIRLVRGIKEFDLSHKLNACLQQANGKWIGRMDDDDYSYPNRFEQQVVYLENHAEVDFVGCNVNLIYNSQKIGVRTMPEYPQVEDFYFSQPYIHPTLLFRKDALLEIGGYSQDKYCILCEDYDLLLRLYEKGHYGANMQEVLFDYTLSESLNSRRAFRYRINEMITRYRRFMGLGKMPLALPYVIKPLMVGLLPEKILKEIKKRTMRVEINK